MSVNHTALPVELCSRRTANGGLEWFVALGGEPIYPTDARVGVFADPDVSAAEALMRVTRQWGQAIARDPEAVLGTYEQRGDR